MAPSSAVLTPNPVGEYAVLKTPEVDNGKPTSG
ncbi:Ferric reduction oxidase 8, partial [Globisporangium polare]